MHPKQRRKRVLLPQPEQTYGELTRFTFPYPLMLAYRRVFRFRELSLYERSDMLYVERRTPADKGTDHERDKQIEDYREYERQNCEHDNGDYHDKGFLHTVRLV